VDVNLYGYNLPTPLSGQVENTFVGDYIADVLDLDLVAATDRVKNFNPVPPSLLARHERDEFHQNF